MGWDEEMETGEGMIAERMYHRHPFTALNVRLNHNSH